MAITRVIQCGFEIGSTVELETVSSAVISSTKKKTGTYSLRAATTNYAEWAIAATREARMGAHFNHNGVSTGESDLFTLRDSGGALILGVRVNPALDEIQIFDSVGTVAFGNLNNLAIVDTWAHVGFCALIDSVAGYAAVYIDGVLAASVSAVDTGNTDIEIVRVLGGDADGWQNYIYMDDFYLEDTTLEGVAAVCPDYRYVALTPNGNGNYSQWDGSDGNNVDNYLLVDDIPPDDDTTYIETAVADEYDTVAVTTHALTAGFTFVSVIPVAIAKKADVVSSSGVKLVTRVGATDDDGAKQTLTDAYTMVWERFVTDPGGGSWGQADIDDLEIGVKHAA